MPEAPEDDDDKPIFDLASMEWVYAIWFVAFRLHDLLALAYREKKTAGYWRSSGCG